MRVKSWYLVALVALCGIFSGDLKAATLGDVNVLGAITASGRLDTSTFNVINGSVTFRGGNRIQGSTVALGGIQFLDSGAGIGTGISGLLSSFQMGPGLELLASTQIAGTGAFGISTMTVNFASSTHLYIVIWSTPATGTPGGDLLVSFNNGTNNRSPMYSVSRTTSPLGLTYAVTTSSTQAIGIPVFGNVAASSATSKLVELWVSNFEGRYKTGRYLGSAVSSATVIPTSVEGSFVWCMTGAGIAQQITSVSVTHIQDTTIYSQAIRHLFGSFVQVWGRRRNY